MSEGDRAFTTAALIYMSECARWRESPPTYEVHPGLLLTFTLVTADQLRPNLPPIFAEPLA